MCHCCKANHDTSLAHSLVISIIKIACYIYYQIATPAVLINIFFIVGNYFIGA